MMLSRLVGMFRRVVPVVPVVAPESEVEMLNARLRELHERMAKEIVR